MCAIRRGLITDYETMKEYQTIDGRPMAMCSQHTRKKRALMEAPSDAPSQLTNLCQGEAPFGLDSQRDGLVPDDGDDMMLNPEEDTFNLQ